MRSSSVGAGEATDLHRIRSRNYERKQSESGQSAGCCVLHHHIPFNELADHLHQPHERRGVCGNTALVIGHRG